MMWRSFLFLVAFVLLVVGTFRYHPSPRYIQFFQTPVAHLLKPAQQTPLLSNLDLVDAIFVINLDRRPERWHRVEKLCQERGLKANRFSGVEGWKLSDETVNELQGPYTGPLRKTRPLRKGEIGCLLSHISVLKEAYERGYGVIWVMEDDIEFVDDVHLIPPLLARLSKIDPDWCVFYTDIDGKNKKGTEYVPSVDGCFRPDDSLHPKLPYYLKRWSVGEGIMRIGQRFCAHSLFISRKGMERILRYFTHVYLYSAYDIDMHYIPGLKQYSVEKDIVSVSPEPSDTISDLRLDTLKR